MQNHFMKNIEVLNYIMIIIDNYHKLSYLILDKFFFNRLVSMMLSGESWIHLLARNNAIQRWRDLMGPTKVFK